MCLRYHLVLLAPLFSSLEIQQYARQCPRMRLEHETTQYKTCTCNSTQPQLCSRPPSLKLPPASPGALLNLTRWQSGPWCWLDSTLQQAQRRGAPSFQTHTSFGQPAKFGSQGPASACATEDNIPTACHCCDVVGGMWRLNLRHSNLYLFRLRCKFGLLS